MNVEFIQLADALARQQAEEVSESNVVRRYVDYCTFWNFFLELVDRATI